MATVSPSPPTTVKRRKITASSDVSSAQAIHSPTNGELRRITDSSKTTPDRGSPANAATQTKLRAPSERINGMGKASRSSPSRARRITPGVVDGTGAGKKSKPSTNGSASSGAEKDGRVISKKRKPVTKSDHIPPDAIRKKPPALTPEEAKDAAARQEQKEQAELQAALEAQIKALKMDVEDLEAAVEREERRVERERARAEALPKAEATAPSVQDMIESLLAANDASFKKLPEKPMFDFDKATAEEDVPSTLPLPMDDPLPQLKMFTDVTFTSSETTVVPPVDGKGDVRQRHDIGGYVGDKYLFFRVALEVDLSTLSVEWVRWETSPWARRELTGFLTQAATECNISSILYAVSSYTTLNTLRAKTFARLSHAFPSLLPQFTTQSAQKGKAKANSVHEPTRRELTPHFGESVLRFRDREAAGAKKKSRRSGLGKENGDVEFVVEWKLQIDDVGEAESVVSADARVPAPWSEVDAERSLKKMSGMFEMLVGEKGVFEAVRCMVGLLFPEHEV